jgi:YidC/Oxa1 family membrane protein insertase
MIGSETGCLKAVDPVCRSRNPPPILSARMIKASTHLRTHLHHILTLLLVALIGLAAPAANAQNDEQSTGGSTDQPSSQPTVSYTARPAVVNAVWSSLVDDQEELEIQFSTLGAGIEGLVLLDEFETVAFEENIQIQHRVENAAGVSAVPFALPALMIDNVSVELTGIPTGTTVWTELSPGVFEAYIDDAAGNPIARIERRFVMRDARHAFTIEQTIENLSNEQHTFRFINTAMIDMPKAKNGYAGDRRRVRFGTLKSLEKQGASVQVSVDDKLSNRSKLLGSKVKDANGTKHYQVAHPVWPSEESVENGLRLSWIAFSDRYFSVVLHPMLDPMSSTPDHRLISESIESVDRLVLNTYDNAPDTTMVLSTSSPEFTLLPGATKSIINGVYAGPRTKPEFNKDPILAALNLPEMVVYNIGGFCAGCTFDWLTNILIAVLRIFHSIVQDWGVSILLLVVVVRGCLHPITRWSQIRMQRFGVQMQAMAPKQKALKEKYKDDPKRMQQEMSKLWREEGISPLGMLGCLPMLLQSPVWIALYATLFFAVELKHEPAFYGIFQTISGGSWMFLSDLSAADNAIPLPSSMHFSFPLWGTVSSINILPLLLGVVFFLHQKYLTPPTQATLTPEQESQQKMMKVMMVVMFPVMMYTAPSGLALYFITNSTMGILENKWIRAHMKKHGMLEIENIKAEKAKKGPGFMQRMNEAAEAKKQLMEKGPQPPNPASRQFRDKK